MNITIRRLRLKNHNKKILCNENPNTTSPIHSSVLCERQRICDRKYDVNFKQR